MLLIIYKLTKWVKKEVYAFLEIIEFFGILQGRGIRVQKWTF